MSVVSFWVEEVFDYLGIILVSRFNAIDSERKTQFVLWLQCKQSSGLSVKNQNSANFTQQLHSQIKVSRLKFSLNSKTFKNGKIMICMYIP